MKTKFTFLFLNLLLCCAYLNAQSNLNNGDFEKWRLKQFKCCGRNIDVLWYWGMSEQLTGLNYNKFVFRETDPLIVHSGICCVQLFSDTTYLNNLILAPGVIAYGVMTDSASVAVTVGPVIRSSGMPLPVNSNPVSLNFFMRTDHAEIDTPYYIYLLTKWDSVLHTEDTLAYSRVDVPDAAENMNRWIQYNDSIQYIAPGVADTVRILFFGGRFGDPNLQGNSTFLDDVSLYYPTTGLVSLDGKPILQVFPDPASFLLTVKTAQFGVGNKFQIFDLMGRSIKTVPVEAEVTNIDISRLDAGNYLYRLAGKSGVMLSEGKFVVVK